MGWSPPHQGPLIALLLLAAVLPLVLAAGLCGETNLPVSIPEYPFISYTDRPKISNTEQSNYRALLVPTDRSDLILTVGYDTNNPGDIPPNVTDVTYYPAFGSNPAGWYLSMLVGLDRDGTPSPDDDRNTLQFQLKCEDPNDDKALSYHVLQIQLEDRNDNPPTFQNIPYSITISELTPVGVTVFSTISTVDSDKGNNRLVRYQINTAANSLFSGTEIFTLASADSPFVVLKNPLDYEAMVARVTNPADAVYRLNITATDKPNNPVEALSSWTLLTLNITDGDDLGPQFVYPSCFTFSNKSCIRAKYDATIQSGLTGLIQNILPVPRYINNPTQNVVIKARDGDALNAAIQCYITDTNPPGYQNNFRVTTSQLGSTNEYQCNIEVISPFQHSVVPSWKFYWWQRNRHTIVTSMWLT
ncbi:cadherin-99C-like [Pomacea canaliculata]|uniref:cadherin-99C-like n=1 Tax=Pomacea canaliculata TaxID=400727 RepID=UPI000D725C66|nr:cadherin-99C-like [Pomacea canaliculata]